MKYLRVTNSVAAVNIANIPQSLDQNYSKGWLMNWGDVSFKLVLTFVKPLSKFLKLFTCVLKLKD